MARLIMPLLFFVVSIGVIIATLNLPKARLGNPNAPVYFPMMLGIFLLILSIVYFIQEWRKTEMEEKEAVQELLQGRVPKLIGLSLLLALGYTLIFEWIGFLISTILFMASLLFLINGKKKWMVNIATALIFSFASWYAFGVLLQVSLP
ncbi:tripartite tricarboxylate transporter TctB family protein [Pontibacillus marinus]|uniref:DUF1468 domain-containing protein n=1 Tax=Pontibacillus marinus BH030004 = DSM 16465 TaxID=1385511 RepID=A0A0A5I5X4_9BACI|nr:tripartite tricarboxylate transporter TctB family protein [Pontibacillus marinus]KGX91232.1 hypothetical protein N783_11120 [Pontibacillus marinus BH030004 = DSM 16465]